LWLKKKEKKDKPLKFLGSSARGPGKEWKKGPDRQCKIGIIIGTAYWNDTTEVHKRIIKLKGYKAPKYNYYG